MSFSYAGSVSYTHLDVYKRQVEGTITDAEFTWRKGMAGTPSEAVVVTGSAQSIAEGVTVKFTAASSGQEMCIRDRV